MVKSDTTELLVLSHALYSGTVHFSVLAPQHGLDSLLLTGRAKLFVLSSGDDSGCSLESVVQIKFSLFITTSESHKGRVVRSALFRPVLFPASFISNIMWSNIMCSCSCIQYMCVSIMSIILIPLTSFLFRTVGFVITHFTASSLYICT